MKNLTKDMAIYMAFPCHEVYVESGNIMYRKKEEGSII